MAKKADVIYGVNLGGWLVLERWITPSLFKGFDVEDEYTLCRIGGQEIATRLTDHRQTFITRHDFRWLAEHNVNAVRVPVGYWVFGDDSPAINPEVAPFYGAIKYLDRAFKWAEAFNINILICLHGAPGSQNGEMHSGKKGSVKWHTNSGYVDQTVEIVARLAQRYKHSSKLWGIELLNEPAAFIPHQILKHYYRRAYRAIRNECGKEVRVVINDIYQPRRWRWVMQWPIYKNVWFDSHQYQIFNDVERAMNLTEHIMYTQTTVRQLLCALRWHHRLIVGEWSAALDARSLAGLSSEKIVSATKQHYQAQESVYGQMDGQFYWTYKKEQTAHQTAKQPDPWSFRSL